MSSQRGNLQKKGAPKHQNKSGWKNVYHDTSGKTKQIVSTEVSGVCQRCKDVIDWKIKYKKYKPLSQPKTCARCKQKTVKQAYNVYCMVCSRTDHICSKCGEGKGIVQERSLPEAQQQAEDRQLEFELELLPERKRRTYLRLQNQGKLTAEALAGLKMEDGEDFYDEEEEGEEEEEDINEDSSLKKDVEPASCSDCDSGGATAPLEAEGGLKKTTARTGTDNSIDSDEET